MQDPLLQTRAIFFCYILLTYVFLTRMEHPPLSTLHLWLPKLFRMILFPTLPEPCNLLASLLVLVNRETQPTVLWHSHRKNRESDNLQGWELEYKRLLVSPFGFVRLLILDIFCHHVLVSTICFFSWHDTLIALKMLLQNKLWGRINLPYICKYNLCGLLRHGLDWIKGSEF